MLTSLPYLYCTEHFKVPSTVLCMVHCTLFPIQKGLQFTVQCAMQYTLFCLLPYKRGRKGSGPQRIGQFGQSDFGVQCSVQYSTKHSVQYSTNYIVQYSVHYSVPYIEEEPGRVYFRI